MSNGRLQKSVYWAVLLSETSHVFCCILPTLFSIISLMAGMGMMVSMPTSLAFLHEALHDWEVPMILFSGAILVIGWIIHWIAAKIDCHDTGCVHGPCVPKKQKAGRILKIATGLFIFNVTIFLFFHHGLETLVSEL